jgi:hypothetical protein
MVKIVGHALDNRAWDLSAAGSIKISDWISVMNPFEGWKLLSDFGDRCDLSW